MERQPSPLVSLVLNRLVLSHLVLNLAVCHLQALGQTALLLPFPRNHFIHPCLRMSGAIRTTLGTVFGTLRYSLWDGVAPVAAAVAPSEALAERPGTAAASFPSLLPALLRFRCVSPS